MKLALVHDWLDTWGGAESVLVELRTLFPDAPLYTLVDFLDPDARARLGPAPIHASLVQSLPRARWHFRNYLPVFPSAMRRFDLSEYDVILSNSHAIAKFARTKITQLHLCYCHTPMRYAWDLREQYLTQTRLGRGPAGALVRALLGRLRRQDLESNNRVDRFVANSRYIADRIRRCYGRDSDVIYPPVDTERFVPGAARGDYYLTVSRLVPYKRVDAIVAAFARMGSKRLVVAGGGPGLAALRAQAPPNVEIVGHVAAPELLQLMQRARAFLFAAEEDFGIAPLEAQACGIPVIALARGGVAETISAGSSGTGVFFAEATAEAIIDAVALFEGGPHISADACRSNALRFGQARFRDEFRAYVDAQWSIRRVATASALRMPSPA